jgi:hypothetical protein
MKSVTVRLIHGLIAGEKYDALGRSYIDKARVFPLVEKGMHNVIRRLASIIPARLFRRELKAFVGGGGAEGAGRGIESWRPSYSNDIETRGAVGHA